MTNKEVTELIYDKLMDNGSPMFDVSKMSDCCLSGNVIEFTYGGTEFYLIISKSDCEVTPFN